MTWRATEELLERVRRQAAEQGRSLNDWVTVVLDAASDPANAGGQAERLRERLGRAGLLEGHGGGGPDPVAPIRPSAAHPPGAHPPGAYPPGARPTGARPTPERLAQARAAAGRGLTLSEIVSDGRG